MPDVTCAACGNSITLPFPWNFPAYTCPRCSHVESGRRARALHLRYFKVELTAATAAEMKRLVPLVNTGLGRKVSREQFFALAVAALAEKYAAEVPTAEETAETAALETGRHVLKEKEAGGAEVTTQMVPPRGTRP